jgi:outer membrane protein TolC
MSDDEPLLLTDTLEHVTFSLPQDPRQLVAEALAQRPELRTLQAKARSLRSEARSTRAASLPALSLTGNAYYANPAPRMVQQRDAWATAWDVSAVLSFTPTDLWSTRGAVQELEKQAGALLAQRAQREQDITIEVRRAYETSRELVLVTALAERAVENATSALDIARSLFAHDESSALTVLEATDDLTRARTLRVNAYADALVASAQLDHALGRDLVSADPSH